MSARPGLSVEARIGAGRPAGARYTPPTGRAPCHRVVPRAVALSTLTRMQAPPPAPKTSR